jgi:3-hydroxyisobutyrate dehydrogenase-like beta-hydroxyacid dehydrogenase
MAGRLLDAGHELVVYNRSQAAAGPLQSRGARVAASPDEAVDAEVVVTMLADDAALEAVWIASGLIDRMPLSTVHVNMGTVSLRMGRRMSALHAAAGSDYVAAPVFGRPEVAAAGGLDIVAAGPAAAIARCRPLLEALGSRTFVVGAEPHLANAVKIARNFLLASLVESLGEALALVRKSGADPAAFLDVITGTSFDRRYRDYGAGWSNATSSPRSLSRSAERRGACAGGGCRERCAPAHGGPDTRPAPRGYCRGFGEKDWALSGSLLHGRRD